MDLVLIADQSDPVVCKIMDYGRFKYEKSKQAKETRKHQSQVVVKEVKFRPKTDDHDLDFSDGKVTVSDRPGFGHELDPAKIETEEAVEF